MAHYYHDIKKLMVFIFLIQCLCKVSNLGFKKEIYVVGFRCNRADISGGETPPSGWGASPLRPSALTAVCERGTGRGGPPLGVVPRPPGHIVQYNSLTQVLFADRLQCVRLRTARISFRHAEYGR